MLRPIVLTLVATLLATALPRVEGQIPESIGPGFPFAAAGAGAILALLYAMGMTPAQREPIVRYWTIAFFVAGLAVYVILGVYQEVSSQP